jgi:PadR family transcriptional regulator, regulatory protein PadR
MLRYSTPLRFSLACPGFSFLFRGVQRGYFSFQREPSEIMSADGPLISAGGLPWQNIKLLWTSQMSHDIFFAMAKGAIVSTDRSEVLQGTLDLLILKTLNALGPLHGFGIARRIEQVSEDVLKLNEGTVYTSLLRLQQQGWIDSEWGTSENNRKARFYSITRRGQKQLAVETENWERISAVTGRVLRLEGGKQL